MEALFDEVDESLRDAGFRKVYLHPIRGVHDPRQPACRRPVAAATWAEIRLLAAKNRFRAVLFVRGGQVAAEHNIELL